MKKTTQKHGLGCGVACVATLLNIKYDEAFKLFKIPKHAWTRGFLCRDIVWALNRSGEVYRHKYIKNQNDEVLKRIGTIVFTARSEKYPYGHYLIRTKSGWMNSWINYPVIAPAKSAFTKRVPGKVSYAIFKD